MKRKLLAALTLTVSLVGLSAFATSIQIPNFDVVSVKLNKTIFPFNNAFVNFDIYSETAHLRIWNDICPAPKNPGEFGCFAEAQLALDIPFNLSQPSIKDDTCGITTQTSNVVTVGNTRHKLVVRNLIDADKVNCLLADVDFAVELHSNGVGSIQTQVSYIDAKKVQPIVPETVVRSYTLDSSKYSGPFFKNNHPDLVSLTVDYTNLKAYLRMTKSACGPSTGSNSVCLAMPRVILEKSFDLNGEATTMEHSLCNSSKYSSDLEKINESLLTVIGAKSNRASISIHDATLATCDVKNRGYLSLDLVIENVSHLGGSKYIVNSKSKSSLRFLALDLQSSK